MTAREESDLNRERNSGRRYAEDISRCYGHARQMLATEKQVADLQRQLMQEKARTANLPPDITAGHVGTEPTAAPGLEADGTDAPAGIDTSETSDEDATSGDWPDSGTEGASGSGTRLRRRMSVDEHGVEAKNKRQAVRSTDATERRQHSRLPIARAQVKAIGNAG